MTLELIEGDCLIELKKLKDKSVDFVYLDLPYGQTACAWDKKIDLTLLWIELKRIARNDRTPFFFRCTSKFGFDLIEANKKWFRWDLVWKKNRAAGFLNAYRLPMRKHEMIYCFAKNCPEYDVSSHSELDTKINYTHHTERDKNSHYGISEDKNGAIKKRHKIPLPTSDITPPTDEHELVYCFAKKCPAYDVSSHTYHYENNPRPRKTEIYKKESNTKIKAKIYDEPLPTSDITPPSDEQPSSWCEFDLDTKTGHRTAKPIKLMEFLLKYWTKEGQTVLDPTAGSGSMGIACKNMKRNFIGIEKDPKIFKLMQKRIGDIK